MTSLGNYTITATYNGSNVYRGSVGTNLLTIGTVDTFLSVTGDTTYTTRTFNITGRLIEIVENRGVANAIINIKISNASGVIFNVNVTTDASGNYRYSNTHNIAGTYTIDVTYIGIGIYDDSNATASLIIQKTPTNVSFNNTTEFIYGRNATFSGVLMDTLNNRPIGGAIVEIFVNTVSVANVTTDANGRFSLVIFANPAIDVFTIVSVYHGNETYIESDNSDLGRDIFRPRSLITYIVVQNITLKPNETKRLTITLFDEFDKRMPFEDLIVTYEGNTYNLKTDSVGNVYIVYTASSGAGIIPVDAKFDPDPALRVGGSESVGYITIEMIATQIIMKNLVVLVFENATIMATLVNEYGQILVGETIDFYFEGEYVGTYITDNRGRIYVELGAHPQGKYAISAHFAGDLVDPRIHAGNDSYNTLVVRPIKTTITVSVFQKQNESTTFIARLIDEFGRVVVDRPVIFTLNGEFIGVAVTDSNGIARLVHSYTPGNKIMVEFLGDDSYLESLDNRPFGIGPLPYKEPKDPKKDPIDPDDPKKNDSNGNGTNKKVPSIVMLKTGNPLAMLALLILCIFVMGIRRRKQKN
jgi:hypothetical protein